MPTNTYCIAFPVSERLWSAIANAAKDQDELMAKVLDDAINETIDGEEMRARDFDRPPVPFKLRATTAAQRARIAQSVEQAAEEFRKPTPTAQRAKQIVDDDVVFHQTIASIALRLRLLNLDEVQVLETHLARIEKGRAAYGPLDLATDGREWDVEALEELVDRASYRIMAATARAKREANR